MIWDSEISTFTLFNLLSRDSNSEWEREWDFRHEYGHGMGEIHEGIK
jgi:hypothetical protein